eukprot:CAMPEP_0117740486 /NCGR_PEP_ID=MMETSP0947-20121206/4371_1 /TAXON_ID=44440 /ORGANISM="Chattonella subsalsa, Strain CCMP2191" /LENGTH=368 /DNA_ID=CAMNT_0005556611 /DNA_START=2084 /DNA_END=3187 /DNA_ORIENTATION=-
MTKVSFNNPSFRAWGKKKSCRVYVDIEDTPISIKQELKRKVEKKHKAVELDNRYQPGVWSKHTLNDSNYCESRSGHDVAIVGNTLYMFGGCAGDCHYRKVLNDLKTFDFVKRKWSFIEGIGKYPAARASFAMCRGPSNECLFISGGTAQEHVFGDLFEYNVLTSSWTELQDDKEESSCKFYGQSMCCYEDNIYFFGGSTGHSYSNDTYKFHLPTQTWEKLTTNGATPSQRYQHTATLVGNSMLIIGGGNFKPVSQDSGLQISRLNLETLEWSTLAVMGVVPCARVSHTADYDEDSGLLFVGGGFNYDLVRLDDFYVLDLSSSFLEWRCITKSQNERPSARAFHASCLHDGALWLFGGADGPLRFNDTW